MSEFNMSALLMVRDLRPEATVQACQNTLLPIMNGIAAIGDLMTVDDKDGNLQDGTVANVGYLPTFLADLVLDLHHIEADAQFDLQALASKQAKAP
jgi:hypothetical protein